MATIDRGTITGPIIYTPQPPVEPAGCPACLSGTTPLNPWGEEIIKAPVDRAVFG
jgi:hypothetical protein